MRDMAPIKMGCARGANLLVHGERSLEKSGAACAFEIAMAHAFVDSNKRTAFVTTVAFLRPNGLACRPEPVEGVRMMEDLAAGAVTEARVVERHARGAALL
jgi:death-on-curing protein